MTVRRGIMDHLRVLLVPFHATNLLMVGVFALLLTFCLSARLLRAGSRAWFLQVWVFKYCYVLVEHLADGATEPPVMDTDMLSPSNRARGSRPRCSSVGGGSVTGSAAPAGIAARRRVARCCCPATVAILGFGERPWQAVNPVTLFRVIRGLGPYYLLMLLVARRSAPRSCWLLDARRICGHCSRHAIALWCEVAFFSLVGALPVPAPQAARIRAQPQPGARRGARRSRTRSSCARGWSTRSSSSCASANTSTPRAPLANWLRDTRRRTRSEATRTTSPSRRCAGTRPAALNHHRQHVDPPSLRFGRPDAALAVFELLRKRAPELHHGFRARPAHAGRIRGEQRARSAGAIHAAGNAGFPAASGDSTARHDSCQQARLTAAT